MSAKLLSQCHLLRIKVKPSPPYLASSNGLIELFVREYWICAWVMILQSTLSQTLLAEASFHGSWLQNLLLSVRIQAAVRIHHWGQNNLTDFSSHLTFERTIFLCLTIRSSCRKKALTKI